MKNGTGNVVIIVKTPPLLLLCISLCFAGGNGIAADTGLTSALYRSFIPKNHILRDTAAGRLNGDTIPDKLLLLERVPTVDSPYEPFESRPLVILYGVAGGGYVSGPAGGKVVLCKTCGDTLGDPYSGMTIRDGTFSIVHKGRYRTFWNRTTTFTRVDSVWFLQKDAVKSRSNPDAATYITARTKKDFGKIRFEKFDVYNIDDHIESIGDGSIFPVGSLGNQSSFCDWHVVKGGIWKVLDYCTGKITPAYLTFVKTIDSESDLGILWEMFINIRRNRDCEALAFRNAGYLTSDSIPPARCDSTDSVYCAGTDSLSFRFEQCPPDEGGYVALKLVAVRNGRKQKLVDALDNETTLSVNFCGDINRDGYIDAVLGIGNRAATTAVYLSKVAGNGTVSLVEAADNTFTD